jgi:opacity protein-like surface antigen
MKRFACNAAVCLVATIGFGASTAQAQVLPADDSKLNVEFNFGPTLGHKSDKFFGGEAGWRLTKDLDIYVEATHMGNVGTSDLDERAAPIAEFLGATASTAYVVNAFDVGVKYNFIVSPRIHPYVLAGIGMAHVRTEVEFAVDGNVIDPGANVQLGSDLSDSTNRGMFVFGFGVKLPFKERFFGDVGYRFGEIFSKSTDTEPLPSIPTQRVVLGVGMRF